MSNPIKFLLYVTIGLKALPHVNKLTADFKLLSLRKGHGDLWILWVKSDKRI